MLLAVDIGNSTISTGLFGLDGELRFLASLDTDYRKTADQICVDLMNLFQLYHFHYEDVTDSILCSVVPKVSTGGIFSAWSSVPVWLSRTYRFLL